MWKKIINKIFAIANHIDAGYSPTNYFVYQEFITVEKEININPTPVIKIPLKNDNLVRNWDII